MRYKITASFWVDAEDSDSAERGAQYALNNISNSEFEFIEINSIESEDSAEDQTDNPPEDSRNPFIVEQRYGYTVEFSVPRLPHSLRWTGYGFKNPETTRANPEVFATYKEASDKIKNELIAFIKQWRSDDQIYICGW